MAEPKWHKHGKPQQPCSVCEGKGWTTVKKDGEPDDKDDCANCDSTGREDQ